jgi:arsenate reductase
MTKPRVLFLCTGNTSRSQMAEAFVRHYAGDRIEAYSAGLEPKEVHPYTRQVMEEIGISMDGHRAKGLDEFLGKMHFGYLITVCDRAERNCPTFPGIGQRLFWPFEDPVASANEEPEKALAVFRRVRDEIAARVRQWLEEVGGAS